jgi:hypothetical protein
MRPKLTANTLFTLVPDGIYLRNNRASFSLKGKNLDHFLELLPSLDGHSTLEEITQELTTDKKNLVTKFLEALLRSGFLKDTSLDQPHTLTQAELATYSSNITFIDSFQTAAASRLASFRNKQLLIIGSGLSFTALVQASLHCGIKQVNIIRTSECGTVADSQPDLGNFSYHDPAQQVQSMASPRWDNESDVLNTIQTCDALLHISDRPMLARAQMLNRLCIEQKKTFIQAIVVDDHAWIGPLVSTETGSCWECAWRRLQSHLVTDPEYHYYSPFRDHTTSASSPFLVLSTVIMAANWLIFELFKHFTQAGPLESAGSLIDIHPLQYPPADRENEENLTSPLASPDRDNSSSMIPDASNRSVPVLCEHHAFLPHPHCHACQHPVVPTAEQFLNQIQQLQCQAPLDPATFSKNMAHLVDQRLGLFTTLGTDDFVQVPLAVYKVGLSNPMLLTQLSNPLEVIGVGLDRSSARVHACQRASEHYAASLVDQRRLLHDNAIREQTLPAIPVDQLIGAPLRDVETWTWALDLHTQQACLIPAPLAFPPLLHGELRAKDKRGIGSGMNWAEAICQALFDWCTFLAIEQVRDIQQRYPVVDLTTIPMTPEVAHLHRLLRIVGEQVTVYDVTGILPVPTFAVCIGRSVVAYSTHCDVAQALSAGLKQALQQCQSRQAQQPAYAVIPMPDLPGQTQASRDHSSNRRERHNPLQSSQPLDVHMDDQQWRMPDQTIPEAWSARQEWLLQTLQAHGFHAWALPLNHDPALMQVFPYIVRVLLARI